MTEIQRICAQCGKSGALEMRYCPHCGFDAQAGLPVPTTNLPVAIGKAALPILAGVAGLALRAGWKLLHSRLAQVTAQKVVDRVIRMPRPTQPTAIQPTLPATEITARRPRRTIHIRSSWAMGDANGLWRQGTSEQTIEIDE